MLVRQILGATTRWSPSGGCDGSARVGKAQAAAAGRRIGPGPKELPHPKDGKNPLNSRKNPPSPSEDSFMDPSVLSPDLIPIMVKKSKNIKNRLTCFASLGSPITRHPSIQRFPQLSRPPRNHRHAQRCPNGNFKRERLPRMHPTAPALRHAAMRWVVSPKPNPRTPRFTQFSPLSKILRSFKKFLANDSSCLFNSKISDADL